MANLRSTDFLPNRFHGDKINADLARAHFLAFSDYLEAHNLQNPADNAQFQAAVSLFKRTLQGTARIWIEDKIFRDLPNLRASFLARFSESSSHHAFSRQFSDLKYVEGDTAEQFLASIRKLALLLGYTELQVRDKFLAALPSDCQSAVLMSTDQNAGIDALVQKAQIYLDLKKNSSASSPTPTKVASSQHTAMSTQTDVLGLNASIAELCNKIDGLLDSRSRSTNRQDDNNGQSSRQRYNSRDTRQQGLRRRPHTQARSYQPKPRPRFQGLCFYCNVPGHKAANCFLRQEH